MSNGEIMVVVRYYTLYGSVEINYRDIEECKEHIKKINDRVGPMSFRILYLHNSIRKEINEFLNYVCG